MAEYIGRRIVPTHGGVWNETKEYEELVIVLDEESGDSYISRIPVPSGTALDDEEYWMLFSIYSEQIQEALDAIEETSEELTEYVDKTAASLTEYVQETAEALTDKVESAEELTNANKDELNERMDNIETRQDANVTASTDSDADYAAEVVDARVGSDDTTYDSLGAHVRSLGTGEAVEELDLYKVTCPDLSMKVFYEKFLEKSLSSFAASYDEQTDTLTLTCIEDYDSDLILYALAFSPLEYARMRQIGGKLMMKFQTSDVSNDNKAFNMGLWTAKASAADSQEAATGLIGRESSYCFASGSGEYTVFASFDSNSYDYDEDLKCYVSSENPVCLDFLLYANSPRAGDTITVCGNGGIFHGIRQTGKETAFFGNMMAAEMYDLEEELDADTEEIADARTGSDGTVYESLGEHVRALSSGDALESLDLYKVSSPDLSMKKFYELYLEKDNSSFEASYDEQTDTMTLTCTEDYSGNYILYALALSPLEYASMRRMGGSFILRFQTSDVSNDNGAFKMSLYTAKASSADSQEPANKLIQSEYTYKFLSGSGEYTLLAPFDSGNYDYDEDLQCYVSDGLPVSLELILYANTPLAGDSITVCGNGGIICGIRETAKENAFAGNAMCAELYGQEQEVEAEVEDARTGSDDTVYDSLGDHVRALGTGEAVENIDLYKTVSPDFSMKPFYEDALKQNNSAFTCSYDEQTDTFTLACAEDYDGNYILHEMLFSPLEYARMRRLGGALLLKFQTTDVVNDSYAFKLGLWTSKTSDVNCQTTVTALINSEYLHRFANGSNECIYLVSFDNLEYDFDEELQCYVSDDGYPVALQILLYANSPVAGESVTICGNGGIVHGVRATGKENAYFANILAGEVYSLTEQVAADEEELAETESEIEKIFDSDARNCRVYDFEPSGVFASGDSTCEIIEDEYGDESYHMIFVSSNPMYQMKLEDLMTDDDREVIIELTARMLSDVGNLRIQLYNYSTGMSHSTDSYKFTISDTYRRYQFRLKRRNIGPTAIGIGPTTGDDGTEVQFKDVKVLIPNEDSKQVEVPLKYFYGCPDDIDFSEQSQVILENPLILGIDDYAAEDGLYLDKIELYSTKQCSATFYIGCLDQYGLLQTLSSFKEQLRVGVNLLKVDNRKLSVPNGYGVFVEWNAEMAVFEGMPDYGINSMVSTEDNYLENDEGYSGYPLETSEYMVPLRYTLIEKPLPILLDDIQEDVDNAEESIEEMGERIDTLETVTGINFSLTDPAGIKFGLLVSEDGTINTVRSVPNRVVVFGNSLTLGFGTFGMAASDSSHDWYYYVQQFLLQKNEDLDMERHGASTWESSTDSDTRKEYVDTLISSYIDGTEDLIIIQLSDNVNSTEKRATFAEDMYTILYQFRTACPNARIVWVAAWYSWSSNYEFIENACTDLDIDLVDIRDLSTDSANQSAVGNIYTKDDGTEVEITSTGVATHPGDTGMELIAERVIELLESYM